MTTKLICPLKSGTYLAKVIEARFHEQRRRVDFNRQRGGERGRMDTPMHDTPVDSKYSISGLALLRANHTLTQARISSINEQTYRRTNRYDSVGCD